MKKQTSIYLDETDEVAKKILDSLNGISGSQRQSILRDLVSLGYLAKQHGFGHYDGKFIYPDSLRHPEPKPVFSAPAITIAPPEPAIPVQTVKVEIKSEKLPSIEDALLANLKSLSS